MQAFELDMAFELAELAAGLERLFDKLGLRWSCQPGSATYTFTLTLRDGGQTRLTVRPLPPERMTYIALFPRTLLEAQADHGADLEGLRRDILLAFLRVTG